MAQRVVLTHVLLIFFLRPLSAGGLLSNIRIGDGAKLTITVREIRFSFWRWVWTFLRAPTQAHLLCIEVLDVHMLVMLDKAQSTKLPAKKRNQDSAVADVVALLDLNVSLKDIQQAIWTPIRVWIHRLNFLCYFVHLVTLSVTSISVDVIDGEAAQGTIVSVKVRTVLLTSSRALSNSVCV